MGERVFVSLYRVEAQQLSKQINNYVERFEDLMKQEKEMTSQHQQSVSYNGTNH